MRAPLPIALLAVAGPLGATVVEQLGYDHYEVHADADGSALARDRGQRSLPRQRSITGRIQH